MLIISFEFQKKLFNQAIRFHPYTATSIFYLLRLLALIAVGTEILIAFFIQLTHSSFPSCFYLTAINNIFE